MADKLVEFIAELCEDPEKLGRFKKDPDTVLSEAGFSRAEQALIKSGDRRLFRAALGGGVPASVTVVNNNNVITNTVVHTHVTVAVIGGSFTIES